MPPPEPRSTAAPLSEERAAELAPVFKAHGDPVRLRLLSMIGSRAGGEVCVCELTPPSTYPSRRSPTTSNTCGRLADGRVVVRSAGSAPADTINPTVVAAMRERGIDLAAAAPKVLTTEAVQASDVVITMGCGDACPVFPGKRYLDWQLDDPAGQDLPAVRQIRDDIERRVRDLLAELPTG